TGSQSAENSGGSSTSHADRASANASHDVTTKSATHGTRAAKKDSSEIESQDDMLARELALFAEARRELLTGDATAALKSVRAARSLEARQLEPEEMSLEARALRQLGRDSEAQRVESQLRTMYPGR
ncbi:MAG: hypothetical protein ACRELY_10205, partial [Polyangiaceae bacterium]